MGQAKKRGNFEERKRQAIAAREVFRKALQEALAEKRAASNQDKDKSPPESK